MDNPSPSPTPPPGRGWIVSPTFDLLFLANVGWLVLLIPGLTPAATGVDFWLVYFISLPHRWITLVLVLLDPDRREGRGLVLVGIAVVSAAVVVGAYFGTGAFLCLALADYLWNAWHFGSQHAGVLRMYARKAGGGLPWLERWGPRVFVVYAGIRAAAWATGEATASLGATELLAAIDLAAIAIPVALVLTNLTGFHRDRIGKLVYLLSFGSLYSGLILCVRSGRSETALLFIAAGALFHAVEYLAIVSHYARRRESVGSEGSFRSVARHWIAFLGLYVLVIGTMGALMAHPELGLVVAWQGLNLWASFVHYAYDGMIWKLRRPATAAALGVGAP